MRSTAPRGRSPKLSVAIVGPAPGVHGGQAVQAQRLLDAWRNDPDVDARLVPIDPGLPPWLRAAGRVRPLRTLIAELRYLPVLVRELRRADVVHVFSPSRVSFLLARMPAVVVAKLMKRPVLMNHRGSEAIPNIVDRRIFRFRWRYPLKPRLLSTRNFERVSNVAGTLRAFALVQRAYPDATLTLVGSGSQGGALRDLAGTLGLRNVNFTGAVAPRDISRYYAESDVYVQTPDVDNTQSSLLEAFASGLPVVSTNPGGVTGILTNGLHGLLAPVGDHETVAANVVLLLQDERLARRLAKSAYESAQGLLWDRVRLQWIAAYRALLPETAGVPHAVHPA